MKILKFSHQFKKDFKRYRHDVKKLAVLKTIFNYLEQGEDIPPQFHPHPLAENIQAAWNAMSAPIFC